MCQLKEDHMNFRFIALSLLLFLSACLAPKPAPSLNLQYTPAAQPMREQNITVALVKTRILGSPMNDNSDKEPGPADTIPYTYDNDYAPRLQQAMAIDIEKILRAKGFTVKQSFDSLDQVPFEDKRKVDLIVVSTFDMGPQVTNTQKIYHYPSGTNPVINTGTVELVGTVSVVFLEPLTMEKVMTKTVDVTSLNSNRPVEYQKQTEASYGFIELLNRVYPRLMAQVEKSINAYDLQTALKKMKPLGGNNP